MAWYIYKGYQYIPGLGTLAQWAKVKNIYRKTTPSVYAGTSPTNFTDASKEWRRQAGMYRKTSTGWRRVFTKTSTGVVFTTGPAIHVYSSPYPYGPNNGISVSSPRYVNEVLYGKDGIWTPRNETSISRSFQAALTPDGANRFVIDSNDVFDLSSDTTNQEWADETYLYYRISVQNYGDLVTASAGPIKLIKRESSFNSENLTGTTTVGSTLTGTYSLENRWYNKPELYNSYIRWWRSTSNDPSGTLVREEYLGDHVSTNNSTTLSGSDTYTIQAEDAGYYIVFQVVPYNSYNRHYGYETYMSYPSNIISAPITISNVNFTDTNGRSGRNARGNFVTNTATNLNFTVGGVTPTTTFRVRYRILNNQTGLYYNPNDPTTALSAGSAWLSYTDDYYDTGTISSVSISGSTATIRDTFTIDSTFNGSTYSGGLSRWTYQYEISVVNSSGTRYYWMYGNSISTTQANDYWDIDPTTDASITASTTAISPGSSVTFTGTFNPYPAGLSSYPAAYRVVYGDGNNSGWITLSSSTANQTYSQSNTYASAGTYYPYIEVTPYFNTKYSSTITVANSLTAPTITSVSATKENKPVTAYFTGGSGPYYQMYWTTGSAPTFNATPDAEGSSSPLTDATGPATTGYTYYMYIRSVSSLGYTVPGPSPLASAWSSGYAFTVASGNLIAPTISSVTVGNIGGPVSVYFYGGDGPYYQAYWTGNTAPTTAVTPDASGSSSPLTDNTGPSSTGTVYMYVRSVATQSDTAIGPSTTASSWSSGYAFNMTTPAPTNSSAPTLTPTSISVGTLLTAGVGSWNYSPTSYDIRIYRGTANVSTGETLVASGTSTSLTYTVTQADYNSGQLYFRTYVSASNAGGSSGLVAGQERGPIATPVVIPSNSSQPTLSASSLNVGGVLTAGVGSWSGSPTSYDLRIYRGTQFVSSGETLVKSAGNVTSTTYTMTQADYNSGQRYFRTYATASNSAGTSSLTAGQEVGPLTVASTPVPVLSSISGNNSLTYGGTFSWSYTNSPTGYSILCQGPTGTVYTTSNAYSYGGTTFRPGYDGTGWQGAGNYTIYVSATNSGGNSVVSSQTTYMS